MKAAYINETGPPEQIIYGDVPKPTPTDDEVLVKVGAVAVNPIDTYIRNGAPFWELPQPFIVGCDLAGTVESVGANVQRFRPGDRVWGSNQGLLGRQGTFAEYCAAKQRWLYPTPDNVDDQDAAAIALVGLTSHLGLFRDAQLSKGETIFIHGGSGGVGSTVVQMAKAVGARVITTGGSDEKVAVCQEMGADEVINYNTENEAERLRELAPEGVNVFWETIREPNFDAIVAALAPAGRIILMAGRDARPEFPVGPFYVKGCSMHGFAMFAASAEDQQICGDMINLWLADGRLKPRIDRVLPLAETAAAHLLQEDNTLGKVGTLAGKIVLRP